MKNKRKHRGNGNRKRQQQRRRERSKRLPPNQEDKFLLIDGNFSYYPVAECGYHGGYLTLGLAEIHRCRERHCPRYKVMYDAEK